MIGPNPPDLPPLALRLLLCALLLMLFFSLVVVLLSFPETASGLKTVVAEQVPNSGVGHPVTAVLINFRGYDTLLEMAVLWLALLGVHSLAPPQHRSLSAAGPVLDRLARLYLPLMLMVAGYLLWRGAAAPGGAFQAGAVIAAGGVMLHLSGWRPSASLSGWPLRLGIILGLVVFITVSVALLGYSGALLQYPPSHAGTLILLIELTAAFSIGITLTALFLGGQPRKDEKR